MAIGIGVLKNFNGNDPSTIIAIGTLDALSAGILAWVGVVEMRAHDWMLGGEMTTALVSSFSYLPSESNASAPSRASKSEVDHVRLLQIRPAKPKRRKSVFLVQYAHGRIRVFPTHAPRSERPLSSAVT